MLTKSAETPANYIRFASTKPDGIIAHKYRDELIRLFNNPAENAGDVFREFQSVADNAPSLRPTFHSAVHSAFDNLRNGLKDYPQRWDKLMDAIAESSLTDITMEKYIRDVLLAKAIPVLVGPQSTSNDLQAASDILTVAGKYENLTDAIKPEYVHPVVKWHLANHKNNFLWAATCLTTLRQSPAFVPVIADIENKHNLHVVGENLLDDPTQILLVEFSKAHHNVTVSVMDTSKPGHHHEPRPVDIIGLKTPHHDQIAKILLASTDLPKQEWVEPIATEAHCRLG